MPYPYLRVKRIGRLILLFNDSLVIHQFFPLKDFLGVLGSCSKIASYLRGPNDAMPLIRTPKASDAIINC